MQTSSVMRMRRKVHVRHEFGCDSHATETLAVRQGYCARSPTGGVSALHGGLGI